MYTNADLALLRAMDPNPLPGVDIPVGDLSPPTKSLSSMPTTNTAPFWYNSASNAVYVKQAGTVLDGYDFGRATVLVQASNVVIKNSTFEAGGNEVFAVQVGSGVSNLTVQNNTFNGGSAANPLPLCAFIAANYSNITGLQIVNNKFLNAPCDSIDTTGGTIVSNYFSGAGYTSTNGHPDAITIANSVGQTIISNNFIDETAAQNFPTNSAIILGDASNVTVMSNVLLGGGYTVQAGSNHTFTNVNIYNNYIGFGTFGAFSGISQPGVTATNNTIFDFRNPIYSTNAWTGYKALGISTTSLIPVA